MKSNDSVWNVVAWGDVRECHTIESVIEEVREALELGCGTINIERQDAPNNTHDAKQQKESMKHGGVAVERVVRRIPIGAFLKPNDQAHPTAAGSDYGAGGKESNGK